MLIVTPFLPYHNAPHAGGILVYESIKALSKIFYVSLLARIEPSQVRYVEELKPFCDDIYLYHFETPTNRNPLPIIFSYIKLGLKANNLIKKSYFDIVQVEYTETGLTIKKPHVPTVLVAHDVITKPAEREYKRSKGLFKKIFFYLIFRAILFVEKYISKKFDMVFVMSEGDREKLLSLDPSINVAVSPSPIGLKFEEKIDIQREPCSLLFVGAMNRKVNLQAVEYFYREILPIVREKYPDVKFYVIGNNPPRLLKKLSEKDPNLIVTGFVKNLENYFLKATVFVSPILVGGGIIVKNIQAMAYKLPVVTTSIGNEGIEAVPGRDLFVADTDETFAEKIIKLIDDPELCKNIGLCGRRYVEDHFNDKILFDKRLSLYKNLLKIRIHGYRGK